MVCMDRFLWLKNDYEAEEALMTSYNQEFGKQR